MEDGSITILVVEDNAGDAQSLQEMLVRACTDCQVTPVERLDDAFCRLEESSFDLIVLDLDLSGEPGLDALARVRARAPGTPAIVLTGPESEPLGLRAVRGGAQDYLVKGQFDRRLLARVVCCAVERARADGQVRASEERWQTYIDTANDMMFTLDSTGRITWANQAARAITGYRQEELLGHSALELIAPESYPAAAEALAKILGQETVEEVALEIVRSDGRRLTLEVRGRMLYEQDGFAGTFHIARDVTARKQAEDALRESENRYRQLFEAESDAVLMIENETGRILEANGAAAAMYGYSRQELRSMRNTDLSAEPEDTQRVTRTSPVVSDRVVHIPLRLHRKKDGTIFSVEITGRFFNWQGTPVHIAAIRDISHRKQAQEEQERLIAELREALARVKTLSGLLPICAGCKRIRDDAGYWTQVEVYIRDHTDAEFSHGLCPECLARLYPHYCQGEEQARTGD